MNNNNLKTDLDVKLKTYNIKIKFYKEIVNDLFEPKIIFRYGNNIIGVINTPKSVHYNSIIINLTTKHKSLNINNNYIYDDLTDESDIRLIKDLKQAL